MTKKERLEIKKIRQDVLRGVKIEGFHCGVTCFKDGDSFKRGLEIAIADTIQFFPKGTGFRAVYLKAFKKGYRSQANENNKNKNNS